MVAQAIVKAKQIQRHSIGGEKPKVDEALQEKNDLLIMYMKEMNKCKKEIRQLNIKMNVSANIEKFTDFENQITELDRENSKLEDEI